MKIYYVEEPMLFNYFSSDNFFWKNRRIYLASKKEKLGTPLIVVLKYGSKIWVLRLVEKYVHHVFKRNCPRTDFVIVSSEPVSNDKLQGIHYWSSLLAIN